MHTTHADAPTASMYCPTPHTTQVLGATAAFTEEDLPTAHAVQALAPVASWYVPATHDMHVPRPTVAANFPTAHASHWSFMAVSLSVKRPIAHGLQEAFPVSSWKVPGTQVLQVAASTNLPAEQDVPVHVLALEAPMAADCFPGSQEVHAAAPVDDENVPAVQAMHTASSEIVRPTGPLFPAGHAVPTQLAADGAAGSRELVPDAQAVHDDTPAVSENFPAIQSVQVAAVLVA